MKKDTVDFRSIVLTKTDLTNMTLLDKLERLVLVSENSGLEKSFFAKHKELIESVASDLQLTPIETVLLCPFINDADSCVSSQEIREFFLIGPIALMRHTEALRTLVVRRYVSKRQAFRDNAPAYQLTVRAKECFCKNEALPVVNNSNLTAQEFMEHFRQLTFECCGNRGHNLIDEEELLYETMDLMAHNPHLAIVQNINALNVDDEDKLIMLYYCKRLVIDGQVSFPLDQVDCIVNDIYDYTTDVTEGRHLFIKEKLLSVLTDDSLFSRDVYKLTNKARKLFLSEYNIPKQRRAKTESEEEEHTGVISSKSITPKVMFYSAEDQKQIDTLRGLLDPRQLQAIRQRLEKAHLRKGFNCLFYGAPGTGKTETAFQLARATGRDIMQVDISSVRSMWYGETEKIVKGIFEKYDELVKESKVIPILLVNEADALLSVRTSIGSRNPTLEKTENAIQNILLEAMENMDGIMIATTNLSCNLDGAFDRRFLYKVEFHQPTLEAKVHIWQNFLPDLADADAWALARAYDFSGGQIENIARKAFVDHLLFGSTTQLGQVMELCDQEQILSRSHSLRNRMGFHK